jgi:hypothetical protein
MSKTKIEELPRLEELDPEDQRLIRNSRPRASAAVGSQWPRLFIQPKDDYSLDDDMIVSRLPPDA